MYGEDIDLSYKVLKAGYNNFYFGQTTVVHFKGESTIKNKIYTQRFFGAMQIFYKKHFAKDYFTTLIVNLGLKLAKKRPIKIEGQPVKTSAIIVVTNTSRKALNFNLNAPLTLVKDLEKLGSLKKSQIIFDTNYIKYKAMIEFMQLNSITGQNTYRILLKNSNFIIGSDSNIGKGVVIKF
jgi:hypothetical protein